MASEFDKQNPEYLFAMRHRGTWHIFPKDGNVKSYCGGLLTTEVRHEKSKNEKFELDPGCVRKEVEETPGVGSWCKGCVKAVLKREDSLKHFSEGHRHVFNI